MPNEMLSFYSMTEAQLRDWVKANPKRVNDLDMHTQTPLLVATQKHNGLPLVLCLLDELGADINATDSGHCHCLVRPRSRSYRARHVPHVSSHVLGV